MLTSIKKNNISGFTLAEILLTLSIIGIVAAITIPTLLNSIDNQIYQIAWRKSYSEIAQATRRVIDNNGGSLKGLCVDNDDNCLQNLYLPYFSYSKACNKGTAWGSCWHSSGITKKLNGLYENITLLSRTATILNNGNILYFVFDSQNCTRNDSVSPSSCGWIAVDVNGFKSPNVFGKDIYGIWVLENSLKPWGVPEDINVGPAATSCVEGSTNALNTGFGCAAKYLYK